MKSLRVTKIFKKTKLEGVWGELTARICFRRNAFTKNLRITLVFMCNSAVREKFVFCFLRVFC